MSSLSFIRARSSSPAAIAAAFAQQQREINGRPLGGLRPILIPMEGPLATSVREDVRTAPKAPTKQPWCPSREVISGCATTYGTTRRSSSDGRLLSITPFAFASAIRDGEVFLTINHREDLRLASRLNGSLRLWETTAGLFFEANPFATEDARRLNLYGLMKRGAFRGASIHYGVATSWLEGAVQVVSRAEWLMEISLITRDSAPADRQTWVKLAKPTTAAMAFA